ncbi:hypothetical protein C356_03405 [Cryptococcus neoformans c45]|nr:hypothetical protein C356_03405 [Cryptococcus neoformans var. grubii c45]
MASTRESTPRQPVIEPRAKRTHARRSCSICKLRKSRCELPDLNVPSGPDPLPDDKACHRCKVLSLPCVVDDSNRKQRKRKDPPSSGLSQGQETPEAGPSTSKRQEPISAGPSRMLASKFIIPSQSSIHAIDHSLDLLPGLPLFNGQALAADPVDNFEKLKRELGTRGVDGESGNTLSIKLHGRPLELTCAMLRVAYGRKEKRGKRMRLEDDEIEVDVMIDEAMTARLAPGVSQLMTYHPHLDDLPTMFNEYRRNPEPTIALLIATVAYLASSVLPPDSTIIHLRNELTPFIYQRRDFLLLHHPHTFFALQVLELFITHCPFGILPIQPANLQTLGVAKGVTAAAKDISSQLNFDKLIHQILAGPGLRHSFHCGDTWLWLALNAAEAAAMLEESNPQKPIQLAEARRITESFFKFTDEGACLWQERLGRAEITVLVGRLALCDKIARLEEVLDGMARIRGVLEHSASDPTVDPVRRILAEFEEYTKKTDEIDRRHEAMISMMQGYSKNIETGWVTYRAIRRRYEFSKLHVTGLRALMATHFLPGSPYAYPDLPSFVSPAHAVAYAIGRACHPPDIVRFIGGTSSTGAATPAVQAVWEWGRRRRVNMEHNLAACAELAQTYESDLTGLIYACIVPLHECICIAVESSKILMEMEAGTIHILRSHNQLYKAVRPRPWLEIMKQVSQAMHNVSMMIHDDGLGGETLANGASNLIGSMVRVAEEWMTSGQEEAARQGTEEMTLDLAQAQQGHDNNKNPHVHNSHRQNGVASHQQYMDKSDRWMAGNEQAPISHQHLMRTPPIHTDATIFNPPDQSHHNYHTPPVLPRLPVTTQLDGLLSDMFGYSCNPAQPPQNQATPQ